MLEERIIVFKSILHEVIRTRTSRGNNSCCFFFPWHAFLDCIFFLFFLKHGVHMVRYIFFQFFFQSLQVFARGRNQSWKYFFNIAYILDKKYELAMYKLAAISMSFNTIVTHVKIISDAPKFCFSFRSRTVASPFLNFG